MDTSQHTPVTEMSKTAEHFAIQQTKELIMLEVMASCPCSARHLRNWTIEQNAFEDEYFDDAIDELVKDGRITVDEDMIVDLPQSPQDIASFKLRQKLMQPDTMAVLKRLADR